MQNFDENITAEFITESKDHLALVEAELLKLDKDTQHTDSETINSIFRAVHSIKGAAGVLGFTKIGELSHWLESILSSLRSNEMALTHDLTDLLLRGTDQLSLMFEDISTSNQVQIEALVKELQNIKPSTASAEKPVQANSQNPSAGGFELTAEILAAIPKTHTHLYALEYDVPHFLSIGKDPFSIFTELLRMGEVLNAKNEKSTIDLSTAKAEDSQIIYLLYSTILEPEMIELATELDANKIKRLELINPKLSITKSETTIPDQTALSKETVVQASKNAPEKAQEFIRINVNVLDKLVSLAGELVLVRNQYVQATKQTTDNEFKRISRALDLITTEIQESIMLTRMQPVANLFSKLPRIARDLSKKLQKQIEIKTFGEEVELDKSILQALADPLNHIIRNACDHGLEEPDYREAIGKNPTGTVKVSAEHEGSVISIKIEDDGRGLNIKRIKQKALEKKLKSEAELATMSDQEASSLILLPGFSTAEQVTDVSGRGVGMDVVKASILELGGEIKIDSKENYGTTFTLRLPLTLAVMPSLIVGLHHHTYAIAQSQIEEIIAINTNNGLTTEYADHQEIIKLRGQLLPIIRLKDVFENKKPFDLTTKINLMHQNQNLEKTKKFIAVVQIKELKYGLLIDQLYGIEEIVVKPMHQKLKSIKVFSGATVRGNGKVSLILDIKGIAAHAHIELAIQNKTQKQEVKIHDENSNQLHLIFTNLNHEYFAIPVHDIKRIERIQTTKIEKIKSINYYNTDNQAVRIINLETDIEEELKKDRELLLVLPKEEHYQTGISMVDVIDITHLNTQGSKREKLNKIIWNSHIVQILDFKELLQQEIEGNTIKGIIIHDEGKVSV